MGVVNKGLKVVEEGLMPTGYGHNLVIFPPHIWLKLIFKGTHGNFTAEKSDRHQHNGVKS